MYNSEDFAADCELMSPQARCEVLARLLRGHGYSTLSAPDYTMIDVVADGECVSLKSDADTVLGWLGY